MLNWHCSSKVIHMSEQRQILHILAKTAHQLNQEKIAWAIGASMLLYYKGITDVFHDIDMMISVEDAPRVEKILLDLGAVKEGLNPNPLYKTKCFMEFCLAGVEIDVLGGMIITQDGTDEDCSFQKEKIEGYAQQDGETIPLYSLNEWRHFYSLMGRENKVRMIDNK